MDQGTEERVCAYALVLMCVLWRLAGTGSIYQLVAESALDQLRNRSL